MKGKLLIIDDDRIFCNLLRKSFAQEYAVEVFSDAEEAVRYIRENSPDVVLTDLSMPKLDGLQVLERVRSESPGTDVVIMTAYAKIDSAIEAMKKGAYDYMVKPFTTDELALRLKKIFEKRTIVEENISLKKAIDSKYRIENIIGESEEIKNLHKFIERVSQTDFTVLISGEAGTGKELAAKVIHSSGKRREKKLISVHCGDIPSDLLDKELFGHEKGPVGEAGGERMSLFEEAEGGTLVLDEIGELDVALQSKLLRVLEGRTLRKAESSQEIPLDVMVILTTSKDLYKLQREGKFRQEFFYLDMLSVRIPPLRDRKEDIPLLARHFFAQYRSEFGKEYMELSGEAMKVLQKQGWPGNVKELKNLFAKICLLEDAEVILPEHVLKRIELPVPQMEDVLSFVEAGLSLGGVEKNLIHETLKKAEGNVKRAARLLNISYDTLRYRMKKFGIEKPRSKQ